MKLSLLRLFLFFWSASWLLFCGYIVYDRYFIDHQLEPLVPVSTKVILPKTITITDEQVLNSVDRLMTKYRNQQVHVRINQRKVTIKSEHVYEKPWQQFLNDLEREFSPPSFSLEQCTFNTSAKIIHTHCIIAY